MQAHGVRLSPKRRKAWLNEAPLDLTRKEFDLLYLLIRNAGHLVPYERVMKEVWPRTTCTPRTIATPLGALRGKLGDNPRHPYIITTIPGQGLRFELSKPSVHNFDGLEIDSTDRRVWRNGERVDLTRKEFELLYLLAQNPNRVMSVDRLMRTVWHTTALGTSAKTLDVHLGSLRRKLGDDPKSPRLITRVRGHGLRFEPTEPVSIDPPRRV